MPPAAPIAPTYTPPANPPASAGRMNPAASSGRMQPTGHVGNGRPAPGGTEPGQRTVDTGGFPAPGARRAVESGYVAPVAFGPGAGGPVDRRSVESGYMAPVARGSRHTADEAGRRHRTDAQPAWPESRSGSHARPDTETPSGSHATGRSVSELLASNGGGTNTPRRRRRRED
jgi:hypothetical protein